MSFPNYENFQGQPPQEDEAAAAAAASQAQQAQQAAQMGQSMDGSAGQFQVPGQGAAGAPGNEQAGTDPKTTLWLVQTSSMLWHWTSSNYHQLRVQVSGCHA